jgi:hypothetical protein
MNNSVLILGDCFSLASISFVPKLMTAKQTQMEQSAWRTNASRPNKIRDESNPEFRVEIEGRPLTYVPPRASDATVAKGISHTATRAP